MTNPFLSQEYVALALIKRKDKIFGESFATMSELNQFTNFMQRKFNEQELGIAIVHKLDRDYFNVRNGIITVTDNCRDDLDMLPSKISNILTDGSLFLEFFMRLEKRRIEILERFQVENFKSCAKDKTLSLVLPKASNRGIPNLKN